MRQAFIFLLLFLGSGPLPAAVFNEFQVKAAFLFNFARFVEWPADAFAEAEAPLVIGVLGRNPFGTALEDIVRGESVGRRRIELKYFTRVEQVDTCHILFIGQSEADLIPQHVAALRGRSILTVSDQENAARRGVMIRLLTEHSRIRLRVNLEEARAAHLTISSQLLRPAEITTTTPGG